MSVPQTPIKPSDINTDQHLWDAFDNLQAEISAGWIVRFCQERGRGWEPIQISDLQVFYARSQNGSFTLNGLVPQYVTVGNGVVVLTVAFVARCYGSSPASR